MDETNSQRVDFSNNPAEVKAMNIKRVSVTTVTLLIVVVGFVGPSAAQTEVKIIGVPDVNVPKPIPHSKLVVFRDIAVSSTRGNGTGKMTRAGTVYAEGYTSVMLSLAVEPVGGGSVTAFLVPTERFVSDASDDGCMLFPLAAEVSFSGEEKVAGSMPFQHQLAFPQYAVFLSNSSDRPVKAQFFVYLRH
jgi:hypothetical protein